MKWNKKHIVLSILLPIQILLIEWASKHPEFIETYYSNGIYRYISKFLRIVFGWLPFSTGDLLMVFGVFILIRFLYRLIRTNFENLIPKTIHFTAVLSLSLIHISEPTRLRRISYAVFCLKKKKIKKNFTLL